MYIQGIAKLQYKELRMKRSDITKMRAIDLHHEISVAMNSARSFKRALTKEQRMWIGVFVDAYLSLSTSLLSVLESFLDKK